MTAEYCLLSWNDGAAKSAILDFVARTQGSALILLAELAPRLPRFRKPWMSEDYRMSIFDAVSWAVAQFQ
jgi:hypothetical protein